MLHQLVLEQQELPLFSGCGDSCVQQVAAASSGGELARVCLFSLLPVLISLIFVLHAPAVSIS